MIMSYILYRPPLVILTLTKEKKKKNKTRKNTEDKKPLLNCNQTKHVSIVHVRSCLFCIKKDYIAMCVMLIDIRALPTGCWKGKLSYKAILVRVLLFPRYLHEGDMNMSVFSGDV